MHVRRTLLIKLELLPEKMEKDFWMLSTPVTWAQGVEVWTLKKSCLFSSVFNCRDRETASLLSVRTGLAQIYQGLKLCQATSSETPCRFWSYLYLHKNLFFSTVRCSIPHPTRRSIPSNPIPSTTVLHPLLSNYCGTFCDTSVKVCSLSENDLVWKYHVPPGPRGTS